MPHPLTFTSPVISALAGSLACSALLAQSAAVDSPAAQLSVAEIEQAYQRCSASAYSTADELQCLQVTHLAWDKLLNQSYQLLLKRLPRAEKAALQHAQREWLAFRNAEWESLDKRYAAQQGTMYLIFHAAKRMELTRQRAIELSDYIALLNH